MIIADRTEYYSVSVYMLTLEMIRAVLDSNIELKDYEKDDFNIGCPVSDSSFLFADKVRSL